MGLKRGIIICSFGARDLMLHTLLKTLYRNGYYGDSEVYLISDRLRDPTKLPIKNIIQRKLGEEDFEWKDHPRWPIRNTNLWLAKAALWEKYESVCLLNDDMAIVHKGFIDGFNLAEKFGVCVPMNPRVYVKYNAMGADTIEEDRKETDKGPIYGTACNVSPMFVCRLHDHAKLLIETYIEELHNCMRGTLAFWFASWRSGITPMYLPEQWCVGASNAMYFRHYTKVLQGQKKQIEPIVLHWGQAGVRAVFKDIIDGMDKDRT